LERSGIVMNMAPAMVVPFVRRAAGKAAFHQLKEYFFWRKQYGRSKKIPILRLRHIG
jgi:hypothetical protein